MTVYLCSFKHFTSKIAPSLEGVSFKITPITVGEAKALLAEGFVSAVGHKPTARMLSEVLGMDVPAKRAQISPVEGDVAVSFQITHLPTGGEIRFFKVELEAAPATREQLRRISELLEGGQLSIFQGAEILGKHFREFYYSLKDGSLTYKGPLYPLSFFFPTCQSRLCRGHPEVRVPKGNRHDSSPKRRTAGQEESYGTTYIFCHPHP
jgi:hypothetical protein